MAQAPSTYHTIEDSQLYFWLSHHTTTNRDASKGKKESQQCQKRDSTEGKNEVRALPFSKAGSAAAQ